MFETFSACVAKIRIFLYRIWPYESEKPLDVPVTSTSLNICC